MKEPKHYLVARVKPWHGGAWKTPTGRYSKATYIQAILINPNNPDRAYDYLSCDCTQPFRIQAKNQKEAIKRFLKEYENKG